MTSVLGIVNEEGNLSVQVDNTVTINDLLLAKAILDLEFPKIIRIKQAGGIKEVKPDIVVPRG